MTMYDRWTDRARKIMQLANQEAMRLGHGNIDTAHILIACVKEGSGVAAYALKEAGIYSLQHMRDELEKILPACEVVVPFGKLPQSPRVREAVVAANAYAEYRGDCFVGTEHLLVGI